MRRIALLALVALTATAVFASSAMAINSTQQFSASVSPSSGGSKKKPKAVTLKVRPYFSDISADAATPFATDVADVFFPKELVFNGKYFKQCARAKVLANEKKCPAGSQVGSGTAAGVALGLTENLTVKIFNGPGGNKVELLVVGSSPLVIRDVIEGKLTKQSGTYGWLLAVDVPPGLEQPAPGAIATLTDFNTTLPAKTIKKGSKKIPYIGLTGCSGKLNFGYTGNYTDGTKKSVDIQQSC